MKQYKWLLALLVLALALSACAKKADDAAAGDPLAALPPAESGLPGGPVTPAECVVLPPDDLAEADPIPLVLDGEFVYGNPEATVSLIEYSELQCPYCAQFEPYVTELVEKYGDEVRVVFRHFPLVSIHDKAMLGSQAIEAAAKQEPGKFNELKNVLFEKQAEWSALSVEAFETYLADEAAALGLDAAQFSIDLKSEEIVAKVDAMREHAMEAGIRGTPTVLIDGFYYQGDRDVESIYAVMQALQSAKAEYGEEYVNALPHVGFTAPEDVQALIDTYEAMLAKYGAEGLKKYPLSLAQSPDVFDIIIQYVDLQEKAYSDCPPVTVDRGKQYTATLTTTKGDVVIELFADKAPTTVNSFVFLARDGWFDNVPFHRVIPGFVAQTGDPSGTGLGSPGYAYGNEANDLLYDKPGMVGMANSGPDTNGSQFFITSAPLPQLDGGYTIFGQVMEGMDVVEKLTPRDTQQGITSDEPDKILSVKIVEK